MKIRNRLYLIFALFLVIFILIGLTIFHAKNTINKATEQAGIANSIGNNLNDLNTVTYEYLLYHEERMEQQWHPAYTSISKLLKETKEKTYSPEEAAILQSISRDIKSIRVLFLKLKAIHNKRHMLSNGNELVDKTPSLSPLNALLASELLVKSHHATLDSLRLYAMAQKEMLETQRKTDSVIMVAMIIFMVVLLISGAFTIRSIATPISKLVEGTHVIGKGNFDYKIKVKSRDEIGELAASFNTMSQNLLAREEELQKRRDENTRLAVIAEERGELQNWINTFDTFVGKFDPDGIGIIFNEAPIKAGGLTKDDVVGKYFPDTIWWSHSEIERTRIVECFERAKTGLSSRIETNFRRADGTPVPIIFNCQPVMDADGKVNYITAEGKTIIEEVKLRDALQEEKANLEKRVKERTSDLFEANKELIEEINERKQAEKALKESEGKFRHLSEEISDGIAVTINGKNCWTNKAFSDIFGYTEEELIGKGVDFLVVPEEAPLLIKRMKDRLAGKDVPSNYETIAKRKDGERINIDISAKLINFEGKQAIQIVVRDITERKQAEARIQHLQSVLKAIRDVNQLIVHEKNKDKLLQEACEILNQSRDYRLVWIGLVHEGTKDVLPAAQAGFEKGYLKSIKITWDDSETGKGPTGTAIRTQKPFVMRDMAGDIRYKPWREKAMKRGYASSVAVPMIHENRVFGALNMYAAISDAFDEEEIDLLVEVSQDIAFALKTIEIEEEIKRTKEFLQSLINNTSDLVCTMDLEGNFLSINRAVMEQMGYEEEDLIGKPKTKLAVDPEPFENAFREVLEKGSLSNVEVPFRRKDGTIADILYSMTLLRDKDGHPIAVAGFGKDITERKRAEEALKQSEKQLHALASRLQEVEEVERKRLARELHDQVGQSLTGLNINLNIISSQLSAEPSKKVAARLVDSISLVEETAERIRNVMADLRPELLDDYGLGAALRWYCERFGKRTGIKTIIHGDDLSFRMPETVESALFRIAQEALTNIAKHTGASRVSLAFKKTDELFRLTVDDNGKGFDSAALSKSKKQHGWGLLTMKERAQAVNGEVRIESEPGKGTRVIIEVGI